MKNKSALLLLATALVRVASAQSGSVSCPPTAVYLAMATEVRGYPAGANGKVAPCERITGSATNLSSANAVAISRNGYLHVNQFNNEGHLTIYAKAADGNTAPTRTVFFANDLIDSAIDSRLNDYVLYGFTDGLTVFVAANGATQTTEQVTDADLIYGGSIAIDPADNLLIEGADKNHNVVIDTLATSQTLTSPPRIRRLTGSNLGLVSTGQYGQFSNALSIAVDPESGELYVYSEVVDTSGKRSGAKVSVFAAGASGNVAPTRVLSGTATLLDALNTGFHTGSARLAVSGEGRLFVSEGGNTILVFAPGASGNTAPSQVIVDSTGPVAENGLTFLGGIGVRSCTCHN